MEQSGYYTVLKPDPQGRHVAVEPAFPGCYSQGETAEEFSAEEEPLDWEGEGWS